MNFTDEIKRKSFHQVALLIPLCYWFLPKRTALYILIPIALLFIIGDILRFRVSWAQGLFERIFGSIVRTHERKRAAGTTFFLLASVLTIVLFPKEYAILSLLFLVISDTAAALIGIRYGRIKILRQKTLEGTAAFLISALIVAFLFRPVPFEQGVVGAIAATVFELFPFPCDDNFTVPLGSCGAMWLVFL